ncbi:MAG: tRNA pseudouridine(38-40) synthase TruA [Bacteroidetes bacterium]|nr:tRNA pseudouridine(38-40) synthase TruA [Bacteroidota bacterium]
MRRIALRLMYDGTLFVGWQRQPNGRSVQEELERMLGRLAGDQPVGVVGAGRTDSGVHAHGQVVHADIQSRYDDAAILHALNRMAPEDLAVTSLVTASADFHARYKACSRSYRYSILFHSDPFRTRYAWRVQGMPDLGILREASARLVGTHNFTTLSKNNPDTPNSVCTVTRAEWREGENGIDFHVTADRFLYGMVRLLVGWQIDCALGRRAPSELGELLAACDRSLQSTSAPAHGLSLVAVGYPPEFDPFAAG